MGYSPSHFDNLLMKTNFYSTVINEEQPCCTLIEVLVSTETRENTPA